MLPMSKIVGWLLIAAGALLLAACAPRVVCHRETLTGKRHIYGPIMVCLSCSDVATKKAVDCR